jgi:RHS repeat-associated protein
MTKITNFVWNSVDDCVISEVDETGTVQAVYTNEPQQYGGVISQRRGTTTSTYHTDALGSTRFLTDSAGNVTDTYLNDAWGNSVASTGTTVNPFKWVGKYGYYTDDGTGKVYVRARMYHPTVARWTSVDPLGFQNTEYFYSANNTQIIVDPTGLLDWNLAKPTVGICGKFKWFVSWIPAPNEREGWIIQEVEWEGKAFGCHTYPIPVFDPAQIPCDHGQPNGDVRTYWEIWYVTKTGKVVIDGPVRRIKRGKNRGHWEVRKDAPDADFGPGNGDVFAFSGHSDSYAVNPGLRITGRAQFLPTRTVPDGFVKPDGSANHVYGSLALASTCKRPHQWNPYMVALTRTVTRSWNCCCDILDKGSIDVSAEEFNV